MRQRIGHEVRPVQQRQDHDQRCRQSKADHEQARLRPASSKRHQQHPGPAAGIQRRHELVVERGDVPNRDLHLRRRDQPGQADAEPLNRGVQQVGPNPPGHRPVHAAAR